MKKSIYILLAFIFILNYHLLSQNFLVNTINTNNVDILNDSIPKLIVISSTSNCRDCYKKISKILSEDTNNVNSAKYEKYLLIYCPNSFLQKRMAIADMQELIDINNYYFYSDSIANDYLKDVRVKSPSIILINKKKIFVLKYEELFEDKSQLKSIIISAINKIFQ
jgi:hypothetical protein